MNCKTGSKSPCFLLRIYIFCFTIILSEAKYSKQSKMSPSYTKQRKRLSSIFFVSACWSSAPNPEKLNIRNLKDGKP